MTSNSTGGSNIVPLNPNVLSGALPARLAETWTPEQTIPTTDIALLPQAIAEADAMLRPIPRKELFALLARTLMLWKLPEDWDDIAGFYFEALEDVPADLVQTALKRARLTLKWFPKPCELREPILEELVRRRNVLARLRTMDMMAQREERRNEGGFKYRPSAEEIAAVERMNQRTKARWAARVKTEAEFEEIEPFTDLKTAHEKLAQVRPIVRKETAHAPADENH